MGLTIHLSDETLAKLDLLEAIADRHVEIQPDCLSWYSDLTEGDKAIVDGLDCEAFDIELAIEDEIIQLFPLIDKLVRAGIIRITAGIRIDGLAQLRHLERDENDGRLHLEPRTLKRLEAASQGSAQG